MTWSACVISTYHPQPRIDGEPSCPQPHHSWDAVVAWHRTRVTTPPAAATIGAPRPAPTSTPSWLGRSGVRKPEVMPATTGAVQPAAEIWPGCAQPCPETEVAAARAPPPVSTLTTWDARGSWNLVDE